MVSNRPVADLKGVVINAYPPTKNENGKWRPANFVIETESGEIKVKEFPGGHWDKEKGMKVVREPISMPGWYNNLIDTYGDTLYSLLGSIVQIKGEGSINPHSMEVEYTVVGESFVVLEDEALEPDEEVAALGKSTPAPVQKNPVPTPPSISEEKMQIMRQSTLGYSATLLAGKEFASPELMMVRTIQVGGKFLEYVISGEMPSFEEEAEPDEDII